MERTLRAMAEEARRPIPDLAGGVSPRRAYADANLVQVDDKSATLLIYGGIYRPGVDSDNPNGEGLVTLDLGTGSMTLNHIPMYGNDKTAGDFNADHMADVRDMGNGHFCAFGDTSIVFISAKGASRVGFKTKKIAKYKGTLDSMWVVDTDPDTEVISYVTLAYDRATGKVAMRLMAQSDFPCLIVDGWPKTSTAFSFVDNSLKIYPSAPSNTMSFDGLTPTYVVPDDTISEHSYTVLYNDDDVVQTYGVRVTNDHVVLIGRDATGFYSVKSPGCTALMKTDESTHDVSIGLRQIGSGTLRETKSKIRLFNVSPDCALTTSVTTEIGEEHNAYPLRGGVLIVDKDNNAVYYYR